MKGETATVDLTPSLQQDTIAYMCADYSKSPESSRAAVQIRGGPRMRK